MAYETGFCKMRAEFGLISGDLIAARLLAENFSASGPAAEFVGE
jgi:hypothetical protein